MILTDLLVYQAATAGPVVSSSMEATVSGGLLQIPITTLGIVQCLAPTTMSAASPSIATTAFLLVASGIKNFKL